jgi:hypothetical protein
MSDCLRCGQQVTRITAKTCAACENLFRRGCNGRHVRSNGKRQCEQCTIRDKERGEKGLLCLKKYIENPLSGKSICTKCRKAKEAEHFRPLAKPGPDGTDMSVDAAPAASHRYQQRKTRRLRFHLQSTVSRAARANSEASTRGSVIRAIRLRGTKAQRAT